MLQNYDSADALFINTSEGYSKVVFIGKDNVAIPYVNIGLMPGNPISKKQAVVEYSYYIFRGVASLFFSANRGKVSFKFNQTEKQKCFTENILVGGYQTSNGAEVTVVCSGASFYIPEDAKINQPDVPFIPIDTPNFKMNMDMIKVESFFSIEKLPLEIKEILGDSHYSMFLE